MDQTVKGEQ